MPKKPHDICWDHEKISNFWNGLGADGGNESLYFSRQKGPAVLKLVSRRIPLIGPVLDLGCGPGYFLDLLLAHNIPCRGADFSPDSVAAVNARLKKHPLFKGATKSSSATAVEVPDGSARTMFFLETLEHFLPEDRQAVLTNIHRALAPGGHLVTTVPWREDLAAAMVICPSCGCRFHQVQHMTRFDRGSLQAEMEDQGFETVFCRPVALWPEWRIYFRSLKIVSHSQEITCPECRNRFSVASSLTRKICSKLRLNKIFHLVYIGKKADR